jgi:glycosyltransferase involved in cell wall biosynthesis
MTINCNNYPLVSIIMNCYNGELYLAEAIKSILSQTYKNFEVIFWDNQSKDNSAGVYKSFKDKRLKYYYSKRHTSLYEARNLAISKSRGEFISFLDTDDLWSNNKLNLQIKKIKIKKVSLVYSNYYSLNQATGTKKVAYKKKLPEGIIFNALLKDYFIGINTVLMRKSIFLKNKEIFNKKFNIIGDFDLFTRISKNFFFSSIQLPLVTYRIHDKNFSKNNYKMFISEFKFWLNSNKLFCDNNFSYVKERILNMEAKLNILNKNYLISLKKIIQISSFIEKIKLLIFILLSIFFRNSKK